MLNAKDLYQYTLLAEVSYAQFGLGTGPVSGGQLASYLVSDLSGWSADMARKFAAEWQVVAHQPNTATAFSATLLEGMEDGVGTGEYVFAARGSREGNGLSRKRRARGSASVCSRPSLHQARWMKPHVTAGVPRPAAGDRFAAPVRCPARARPARSSDVLPGSRSRSAIDARLA